jgi:hypothetical protein
MIVKETLPSQPSMAVAAPKEGISPHTIGLTTTGQVMTGGRLSSTAIVALHVLVLPQSSVAVHVRVTLYSCGHKPSTVISEKLISTTASHASIAMAIPKSGIASHAIGLITTGQVMTGAVLSCIKIVAEQLDELPHSSVAIQVRVTLYSCGQTPEALTSEKVINGNTSHASIAVAVPKDGVVPHSIGLRAIGQVISGAVLSCTSIVLLQVAVLPQSSVAVQVRVKVYSCPQIPAMESVTNVIVTSGSQSSMTVGVPKTGSDPHSIGEVTVAQVISGAVLSDTSMI